MKKAWGYLGAGLFSLVMATTAPAAGPVLLFYLPFDGNTTPAVAKGSPDGKPAKPELPFVFVDGVKGKAIYNTVNAITFPAVGNLAVSQGTITFWAKPIDWDPQKPEAQWRTFFDANQRTGAGGDDKIAFWRYPESISKNYNSTGAYNYHSAQGNNLASMLFDIKDWKQNQWRFFALTWDKDGVSHSYLDGKLTATETRKKETLPVNINNLMIAATGSALDEFKVFGATLTDEEITKEYRSNVAPAATGPDAAAGTAPAREEIAFPTGPVTDTAAPFAAPITLDGRPAEPTWKHGIEVRDMVICGGGNTYPTNQTAFRAGYTPETLYLFVECPSRAAKPKMTVRDHDGPVFTDDSIEIFIEPEAGSGMYYQFAANALGARYEGCKTDASWNGEWDVAALRGTGAWYLEIAIPFATLGIKPEAGKAIGFNLCRNDFSAGGEWQTWARLPAAYHDPAHFGRLILGAQPLGLNALVLKRTVTGDATLDIQMTNAGKEPAEITIVTDLKAPAGSFTQAQTTAVEAGKTTTAALTVPGALKQPGTISFGTAVLSGKTLLALSSGKSIPYAAIPVASGAGDTVILENAKVRFEFAKASGDLVAMVNKATGTELMPRRQPAPVFALEAVPFKTKSITFTEDDVQKFEPDSTTCLECVVEGNTLRQKHILPCGAEVQITVTLPPDSELSQWDIRVQNQVTSAPSRSFVIHRILFPKLRGLRVDDSDAKQALAVPMTCGLLIPSPVANLPKIPSYMLTTERGIDKDFQNGKYAPTWASMSWLDLSGTKGGLYLVDQDIKPVYDFTLETTNDQENSELELAIKRFSTLLPGESWQPGPSTVGVHPGDWHWSADRYREWFYANFKPRPLPQWLRDISGWTESGGGRLTYTWNDLPDSVRRAKPYGLGYVQKWCNMAGGELGYAAFPFPNPYAGSLFEFTRAVTEIHKLGGRLGFYHNLITGDPMVGRFIGQDRYRQKLGKSTPVPDPDPFANGILNSTKMTTDGTWWTGGGEACYLDGYWWSCVGSKVWMDYNYDWLVRWRKEYKLDACYLDSTGPYAAVCFNLNHGHAKPAGQMQFTLDFYRRLAAGTDADYAICQEFAGDRLMLNGTHSLTCMHLGVFSEPAIFRYVHSDYPLFCGCVNFFGGRSNLLDGAIPDPSWTEFLSYVYLYGARFDHFGVGWSPETPEEWLSEPVREERDLLLLRHRISADLNWRCDFRDRIGLAALPEKLYSRVFVRKDKSGALLTLFDLRPKREPFVLTLDLNANGLGAATGAELIVGGGKTQPLAMPVMASGKATVTIPAFTGKTAAVRFLTGSKELP